MEKRFHRNQKAINEWRRSEEMLEFGRKARIRFYEQEIKRLTKWIGYFADLYIELRSDQKNIWALPIIVDKTERISKQIERHKRGISALRSRKEDDITPEMVERAREHPVENLVEVGPNKRAKCCFHGGEDYNMDIRKGYAFCYVCGASGDAIDVYKAVHGVGFREAVKALA